MLPNTHLNSELRNQYQADAPGFLKNRLDAMLAILAVSPDWQRILCAKPHYIDLDQILLGVHETPGSNGFNDRFSVKGLNKYSLDNHEESAVWQHACHRAAENPDTIIPLLVLLLAEPNQITDQTIMNSVATVAAIANAPARDENDPYLHNTYALRMFGLLEAYLELPPAEQKLTAEQRAAWREKLQAIAASPAGNLTQGTFQPVLANQLTLPMIQLSPKMDDHALIAAKANQDGEFNRHLVGPIASWVAADFEFSDSQEKGEICLNLFKLIMPNAVYDFSNNANAKSSGRLFDTYNALMEYGGLSVKTWHCNPQLTLADNMRFVEKHATSLAEMPNLLQPMFESLVRFTLKTQAIRLEIRTAVEVLIATNPAAGGIWTETLNTQLKKIANDQTTGEEQLRGKAATAVAAQTASSLQTLGEEAAARAALINALARVNA